MHNIILISCLLAFLEGCVSQEAAPIEYNNSKEEHNSVKMAANNEEAVILKPLNTNREYDSATGYLREKQPETPINISDSLQDKTKVIYHEVQVGETIEQIAEKYGTTKDGIININDLTPPFKLEEFQIIKIQVSNDILNKRNREQQPEVHNGYLVKSTLPINNINIIKPVEGTITTKFGAQTKTGRNNGINIQAPAGTPVKSVADGIVTKAGNSVRYGNLVIVKIDESNLFVAYAHLKDLILTVGQKVSQGDIIGHVGSTGDVDQAQLHFAIKDGEKAVDPLVYIQDLEN